MTTIINANASGLTSTVDNSGTLALQTGGSNAIVIGATQVANFASTGGMIVPVGTTAQRPTGVNGMIRYNSDSPAQLEAYLNGAWVTVKAGSYQVAFLVIAGGGGGAVWNGGKSCGGGGAGGYRTSVGTSGGGASAESNVSVTPGTSYTITVGAGGGQAGLTKT